MAAVSVRGDSSASDLEFLFAHLKAYTLLCLHSITWAIKIVAIICKSDRSLGWKLSTVEALLGTLPPVAVRNAVATGHNKSKQRNSLIPHFRCYVLAGNSKVYRSEFIFRLVYRYSNDN
eukprot:491360-Pleurochrysis_carterae.AAC.3